MLECALNQVQIIAGLEVFPEMAAFLTIIDCLTYKLPEAFGIQVFL